MNGVSRRCRLCVGGESSSWKLKELRDLEKLEREIGSVTGEARFQELSREISGLLAVTPMREIFRIMD